MTPNELAEAARCYTNCIPQGLLLAVMIVLAQQISEQ